MTTAPMTRLPLDPPDPSSRPARGGGLTLPVLAAATLIAAPAMWQCLVRHVMPVNVMLERYVVIALGCWLLSEAARRWFGPGAGDAAHPSADAATAAGPATEPLSTAASPLDPPLDPPPASPFDSPLASPFASPLDSPLASPLDPPLDPALALLATED